MHISSLESNLIMIKSFESTNLVDANSNWSRAKIIQYQIFSIKIIPVVDSNGNKV